MIIVRVGLAREQARSVPSGEHSGFGSGRGVGSSFGFRQSRPPYGQRSLAVEITQFIETDGGVTEGNDTTPIELKAKASVYADSTGDSRRDVKV